MFMIFKLVSNMYYHVDPINYQIMNYLIIKSLVRYLKKANSLIRRFITNYSLKISTSNKSIYKSGTGSGISIWDPTANLFASPFQCICVTC